MSSCLSGGGRTYGFDLEMVKSSSTSTRTSETSSPSSTLSESSNSPLAISTRKPRTPRKRPNQTSNEAAVLLSTAYPNIFSTKHITNPHKYNKSYHSFSDDSSQLFMPFRVTIQETPSFRNELKASNFPCQSPAEMESQLNFMEDFDTESILDEEIEQGIDSIMGNPSVDSNLINESLNPNYYGTPMGLGFGGKFEFAMRRGLRALKQVDDGNWWRFPKVDVHQISPKFNKISISASGLVPSPAEKRKKKMEKLAGPESLELAKEKSIPNSNWSGLQLKLNYEMILDAWSNRESPISKEIQGSEASGNDIFASLAQIDLFSENGGVREASVSRYKEKRRTRLFSKKIRYQVRKVNADQRPRIQGRFVRRLNSSNTCGS